MECGCESRLKFLRKYIEYKFNKHSKGLIFLQEVQGCKGADILGYGARQLVLG